MISNTDSGLTTRRSGNRVCNSLTWALLGSMEGRGINDDIFVLFSCLPSVCIFERFRGFGSFLNEGERVRGRIKRRAERTLILDEDRYAF